MAGGQQVNISLGTLTPSSAGAPVEEALTGVEVVAAAGSVAGARLLPLRSRRSVSSSASRGLVGQSVTISGGILLQGGGPTLSGQQITGQLGAFGKQRSVLLTGSSVSIAQTTIGPSQPAEAVSSTFDSLYAQDFALVGGTTYLSRPTQTKPASKASSLASASYIDQRFSTRIYRATDVADGDGGITYLRHEYSRRQAFNCDSTRFIAQATNGWWYLYNADTFAKLDGGRTTTPGLGGLGTGTTGGFGGDCEPIWHPTDPNKIWYMDQNGGMATYEFDIVSKTRTTYINWQTIINTLGASWSTVARVWWQGEGRPSDDGDVWGMSCQTSGFNQVGFIMYRKSTNTVLGSILTTNKPNNVSTSPSGTYCVPSWATSTELTFAQAAAASINSTNGTRAYSADFSTFTQLSHYGEHSDTAIDALGNDVLVSINYQADKMLDVSDGYIYYRRMDNGVAYDLHPGYTGSSYAWHMSGTCSSKRPGWCVTGSYAGSPGSAWKDEVVMAVELVPSNSRIYRLAHHQSPYTQYWDEPHATVNHDFTRVMFASNFNATNDESYTICLPSWALPDRPQVGVHGVDYDLHTAGTSPISVNLGTTQTSGSSIVFCRAGYIPSLAAPTDNKGNSFTQLQSSIGYGGQWADYGLQIYADAQITGGATHTISNVKNNNAANESTLIALEVKNGGSIAGSSIVYRSRTVLGATYTSNSVTTTGPALLVSFWGGDGDISTNPIHANPESGWTKIEEVALLEAQAPYGHIQMACAVKHVEAAGTYTASWVPAGLQGGIIGLVAVQKV